MNYREGTTITWLLDVDGVLNAVETLPRLRERAKAISEGRCWDDYTAGEAVDRRAFGIIWSPKLVERIIAVHNSGHVDIRWLTTWEERAQTQIAPLLGLPHFELAGSRDFRTDIFEAWWKLPIAMAHVTDERPLIWTDDDLTISRGAEVWGRKRWDQQGVRTMLVSPKFDVGLSPKQMDAIEDFVAEHARG